MFSVALVGADGAGKTTIARSLADGALALPTKYLYMSLSPLSSNFALPTSRLVMALKIRTYRRRAVRTGAVQPENLSTHDLGHLWGSRSAIWRIGRFMNHLAEAWYRQLVSMRYRLRGYIVVYDRHFAFQTAPEVINGQLQAQSPINRLEHWIFSHVFPRPDLVIFLDASPQVLYDRKHEGGLEHLERERETILAFGQRMPNFVRVDATKPFDEVLLDVQEHILEFNGTVDQRRNRVQDEALRLLGRCIKRRRDRANQA